MVVGGAWAGTGSAPPRGSVRAPGVPTPGTRGSGDAPSRGPGACPRPCGGAAPVRTGQASVSRLLLAAPSPPPPVPVPPSSHSLAPSSSTCPTLQPLPCPLLRYLSHLPATPPAPTPGIPPSLPPPPPPSSSTCPTLPPPPRLYLPGHQIVLRRTHRGYRSRKQDET